MAEVDVELWMQELLRPLDQLEAVSREDAAARHWHRRLVLGAAMVAAAAVLVSGAAFAAGTNPFAGIGAFIGIGAADHPRRSHDVLDPQTAAVVRMANRHFSRATIRPIKLLPRTARLVGHLPGGGNLYVLESSRGDLCVVAAKIGGSCGPRLTARSPTTISSFDRVVNGPGATPPITWGVTRDGVTSVSFRAGGHEKTVPVVSNVWFYVGHNNAGRSLILHFADGHTQTVVH